MPSPKELEQSTLERFFLDRIDRCAHLFWQPLSVEERTLVCQAILSSYRDCVALGIDRRARALIRRALGAPIRERDGH